MRKNARTGHDLTQKKKTRTTPLKKGHTMEIHEREMKKKIVTATTI